jgi:DNA-binding NtrC family response regulator
VRLQAKLLRAIQEREVDRLGGAEPVKVNVRLIATTNRDLLTEVKKGTFREDLYFRLNVISMNVPSLRERPGDIAPLAEYFSRKYAEVNGLPGRQITAAAMAMLEAHSWRGNVRELENTIHRAVLLAPGDVIDVDAIELGGGAPAAEEASQRLVPAAAAAVARQREGVSNGQAQAPVGALVGRTVADVERDLILETLTHCLGNRTHAATILGISIRTLRNKLRDYSSAGVKVPPPAQADRVMA